MAGLLIIGIPAIAVGLVKHEIRKFKWEALGPLHVPRWGYRLGIDAAELPLPAIDQ